MRLMMIALGADDKEVQVVNNVAVERRQGSNAVAQVERIVAAHKENNHTRG